jgi:class 3 adenylate cyclase/streptogramin lyase
MKRPEGRLVTASERRLLTVLFTDIVGSTDVAVEMGDARWRELVSRHHRLIRTELKRFGGKEIDTAGDGFFATFERPAQAIRCAAAVVASVRMLGIEVRAGLHLGEVELADGRVGGVAVHTGARVLAAAGPGEVLVTSTLRELVSGSGLDFADRGMHQLKGIPGEWQLFALVSVDDAPVEPPLGGEAAAERRRSIEVPTLLRKNRTRALLGATVLVAICSLAIALAARSDGSRASRPQAPPLNSVVNVDPADGRILHLARRALAAHGGGNPKLIVGEGGVWVRAAYLTHLDPATGEIVGNHLTIETNGIAAADRGIEVGDRTVWVGGGLHGAVASILRWDPATDQQLGDVTIPSGQIVNDVEVGGGNVWATFADGRVVELDAASRHELAETQVHGIIDDAVLGAHALWTLDLTGGTLTPVNDRTLRTGKPASFPGSILDMAADTDHVWLLESVGHDVIPVSATGHVGDPVPVGPSPSGIAVGLGAVWVSDEDGDVYRIDPLTLTVTHVHVGGRLTAIAVDEGSETLWLTVGGD